MAMIPICDGRQMSSAYHKVSSSSYLYENTDPQMNTPIVLNRDHRSPNVIRPCYYILQILGVWKPRNGKFEILWCVYRVIVFLVLLLCLAAIMCLDFVHNGFTRKSVDVREIINNACTCIDFLCPFVFTVYYFHKGQFVEVVTCVQNASEQCCQKLRRIARWYSLMSVFLWGICAAFFMMHWFPFFSKPWHYAVYVPVIVCIAGWWGTWLTIYGFVCHVHSLQIDVVIQPEMKSAELNATTIFKKFSQLQTSLEETQKDFNVIISLALAYHTVDLIVFSFAYLSSAFGSDYPLWQFVGTVLFDLTTLIFKLYPPAIVAAAVHRIVVQACKRCRESFVTTDLPLEDMQLFQYMALCEPDMGLKILGIRITVELSMKILMAIFTAAISFVSFVLVRLK